MIRGAAAFYSRMRPESARQRETIKYESATQAVRVCPTHGAILDDEGCCEGSHYPEWWEVRQVCAGELQTEVWSRASIDDGWSRGYSKDCLSLKRSARPRRPFDPERRSQYLAETAYHLRQKGLSHPAARALAEKRWEAHYAEWRAAHPSARRPQRSRAQYISETAYDLRRAGKSPAEAKAIAEERWAKRSAITLTP